MRCPILAAGVAATLGTPQWIPDKSLTNCLMANCAWWEKHFSMCCIAVDAYLKGEEDRSFNERIERMELQALRNQDKKGGVEK